MSNDSEAQFVVLPGLTASTRVSLRFFGNITDPAEITKSLGCPPTTFRKSKGDLPSAWILSGDPDDRPLDEQVQALLASLPGESALWEDLCARFQVDLFCGLFLKGPNSMAHLSSTSLRLLADKGIKITLDMYCDDES